MRATSIVIKKVFGAFVIVGIVTITILSAVGYAYTLGDADAENALATAPQASVELTSSNDKGTPRYVSYNCDKDAPLCYYRVILIDDRYVYLRPLDTPSSGAKLYAVPIGDVISISYID